MTDYELLRLVYIYFHIILGIYIFYNHERIDIIMSLIIFLSFNYPWLFYDLF